MKNPFGVQLAAYVPTIFGRIRFALRRGRTLDQRVSAQPTVLSSANIITRAYASLMLVMGLVLAGGGTYLLMLHGSPYYFLCGVAVSGSALLLWQRRGEGVLLYALVLLASIAWALWEAGYDGWALMPRVATLSILGLVLLLPVVRRTLVWHYPVPSSSICIGAIAVAAMAGAALRAFVPPAIPADPIYQAGITSTVASSGAMSRANVANGDWRHYGNDPAGTRFSALAQITPANVAQLKRAWSYHVGPSISELENKFEVTPIKVDRTLYLCTGANDIVALDAETGTQLWRFDAHADVSNALRPVCRGVAYYKSPVSSGACAERIITNTLDARLIAVDARDGKPCRDFGSNGEVSLLAGMGEVVPGYYYVTSAPTIVQDKIVLGGMIRDNQHWEEPSGVVRAFDAITGRLAWAWDMGHPDRTGQPAAGESYTPATPNSWAPMSADEALGLVYVPTGNATPDFFGGHRRAFDERYSSSIVALDAATGRPRWSFQTVHHDLWDYDVPAQPTLVELPTKKGIVAALIQPSKSGEIFILDRATGEPIFPVEERPVPQAGAVPEERLSPTQPYSTATPSFRGADVVEPDMWGITPLDQLWCRIQFHKMRYEGPYTPPGLSTSMTNSSGALEWGGIAIDRSRNIAIVNSNHNIPFSPRLVSRPEAEKLGLKRFGPTNRRLSFPQEGTPYGVAGGMFMSPLQVPCIRPPYGRLSAVDLTTAKLIWTQPFGSARDMGPFGLPSMLPITLGIPNLGGATVTDSGLLFIGASFDRSFRAFETTSGRLLWQVRLPAAGVATPMTYLSPDSGRQFVVIAAGGHGPRSTGNYILAYALPEAAGQRR